MRAGVLAAIAISTVGSHAAAQSRPRPATESSPSSVQSASSPASTASGDESIQYGYLKTEHEADRVLWLLSGGVWVTPRQGQQIRADSGVATFDTDAWSSGMRMRGDEPALPRRPMAPPDPRRELDEQAIRARLERFAQSVTHGGGKRQLPLQRIATPVATSTIELVRTLYLEGHVVVIQDGFEALRCKRMSLSLLDDRAVFEDVEMRLSSVDKKSQQEHTLVLRAPKVVRQGTRIVARDATISSCTAGVPHIDLRSTEVEIIERGDALEVRTTGNAMRLSGTEILPLPPFSFLTTDENEIPIQGASAGYSNREGVEANVRLGASWSRLGGLLHEALTGRPRDEFRGKWLLDLGWIEERGFPVRADVDYGAEGQYHGRLRGFTLDDHGKNIRQITHNFDGSPITNTDRSMVHTENRVDLSKNTTLDLTLHKTSDAAIWSEFYQRNYFEAESPETSVYLRSGQDNRLLTATLRFNLDDYSYTDSRALAPSFVEQVPYVTYDWFSQPIAQTPFDTPILLTSSSSLGYLRHNFDATNTAAVADGTLRIDQELEVAAPFTLGPIGVRPFGALRLTHYDETNVDGSEERFAYATGISVGSRLAKTWSWFDGEGKRQAIRHVVSPVVTWINQMHVDGQPSDFRQFDSVDTLTESNSVRVELLNRLQKERGTGAARRIDDFVWLDLAQTLYPDPSRDNGGDTLGLFEYELILRPDAPWSPLPNPRFLFEGERDWDLHKWRTANFGMAFGPLLDIDWRAEYRTDMTERGQIGYGGSASVFQRWILNGGTQYDLDLHRTNNYSMEIVRVDHDWRIHLRLSYDNVSDSTSFTVEFEPTIGGLVKPRGDHHWVAGDRLWGNRGDFTSY